MFTCVLGHYVASTVLSVGYPNLSEGADRVGGQLRGDKECPFSDITSSGRVWRKVPEGGAWSVNGGYITFPTLTLQPDAMPPMPGCRRERTKPSLPASLSGTFLQTLPDLVTPLKGHSLSTQLSSDAVRAPRKVRVLI